MTSRQEDQTQQGGGGGFSIWGFGSSVLENVTQNATSFVSTIVETDWNKEFQEIQEGLREDTQTLESEVEKKLGISHAKGEASATRDAPGQRAGEATGIISDFGRRLVHGTAEIFQQVRQQVDAEFTNLEQEAAKKPRSAFPKRTGAGKFSRFEFQAYAQEARQAEAEYILASNTFMADLHSRLVPLVISDDTFWQRYFFRVQLLKSEHEKRDQRLRQAHRRAGSEAGELPLDEPFDDLDDATPAAAAAPQPAAPASPTSPLPGASQPRPATTSPSSESPPAQPQRAEDDAVSGRSDAPEEGPGPAAVAEANGSAAFDVKGTAAGQESKDTAEVSVGDEVAQSLTQAPAGSAQVAAEGEASTGESAERSAAVAGPFPGHADSDTAAPAAAHGKKAVDGVAGAAPAAGSDTALHARVETTAEGDEHACGSSAAGSAARSPQSSGNVVSSEWSIVSGTQVGAAGGAVAPAHTNGVHKEHVPAVEEGEERGEDIDVQEEDMNFDDLDSLEGGVVDNGDDDEEDIDENWGQWE